MPINLSNLQYTKGSRDHRVKRVGRGFGGGIGGRSTRGTKGQNARKSGGVRLGFEGGQMPLYRKVSKYGFNNYNFKKSVKAINIKQLEYYPDVAEFTREVLEELRLIHKKDKFIKFIGNETELTKFTIHGHQFSKGVVKLSESKGEYKIIEISNPVL